MNVLADSFHPTLQSEFSLVSPRARAASGATIEGYLEKRGAWLIGYSNRYVRVFSGGSLCYYLTETSPQPLLAPSAAV